MNQRFFILLTSAFILLTGCTSTKPPSPTSPLRDQAQRTLTSAREAYSRDNFTSAAQLYARAAETFAALDDSAGQADALHNQAQAFQRARLVESAVESYEKALALNERLARPVPQAQNLTGLAQCAAAQNRYDLAIETGEPRPARHVAVAAPATEPGEQARKLAEKSPAIRAIIENDLAVHLLDRGQPTDRERILSLLTAAANANHRLRNTRGVAVNDLNFGRAHLQFAQLDLAEAQLARALAAFRDLDDVRGLGQTHELLAQVYAARGEADRAQFHRQQALDKFAYLKDEPAMKRVLDAK